MNETVTAPQERKGKLDATTTPDTGAAHAATVADAEVNGPFDEILDWPSIDWRQAEDTVRRLRQRIFTASKAGDLKKVRNLQKLMLRCRANALVSVRRVTEINAGRTTPGIDGRLALHSEEKAALAGWMQHHAQPWTPRPVKRVYISKANGRRRPLGIPVIADRALQALTVNALEPEWEARFEPRSYGFVRHEVRGIEGGGRPSRRIVAAVRCSWGQPEPGNAGKGGKQPRQRRDGLVLPDGLGSASEIRRWNESEPVVEAP
ncbi:hypothetical protein GCM10022225_42250 [Plantactinospora mayteni]|uniref:Reverse transcriptase N-terminal domain-containing protein n=1 Tax=Plantactinospora mayteni TaxID=566021 RepID=A0ABQ4EUA7_9ACTN|nr:reverse transcriptase N-terminal domain-containing protein [Plantactinospora mayteni]GIG98249.1 hypothetical protein Pma05_48220 [Plantactinospora mayteni]